MFGVMMVIVLQRAPRRPVAADRRPVVPVRAAPRPSTASAADLPGSHMRRWARRFLKRKRHPKFGGLVANNNRPAREGQEILALIGPNSRQTPCSTSSPVDTPASGEVLFRRQSRWLATLAGDRRAGHEPHLPARAPAAKMTVNSKTSPSAPTAVAARASCRPRGVWSGTRSAC